MKKAKTHIKETTKSLVKQKSRSSSKTPEKPSPKKKKDSSKRKKKKLISSQDETSNTNKSICNIQIVQRPAMKDEATSTKNYDSFKQSQVDLRPKKSKREIGTSTTELQRVDRIS